MDKPIINIEEIALQQRPAEFAATGAAALRYDARMGQIAPLIGATQLGYNITAVPAGKSAFPRHNHRVNEEMFLILEGQGELRYGEKTYTLKAGDIIACPAGGNERAHQILNTGDSEMRYLAVSTRLSPEIVEYPDSGKFGILAEFTDSSTENARSFYHFGREGETLDYWEGE